MFSDKTILHSAIPTEFSVALLPPAKFQRNPTNISELDVVRRIIRMSQW